MLTTSGTNVNAATKIGVTPLHVVWDASGARVSLDAGADVNALTRSGETPLDRAIELLGVLLNNKPSG